MRRWQVRKTIRRVLGLTPSGVRSWRPEWLPGSVDLKSEAAVHPHIPEERPELFLAQETGTTEMEVLNWLHASICMTKPQTVLETGAYDGFGTVAMAAACRANGFGHVHSIEIDPESCSRARALLGQEGLSSYATVHCEDSLRFLRSTGLGFQFGFFDSLPEIRAEEFAICRNRGILSRIAVFHDTSPHRTKTLKGWPEEPEHRRYRETLLHLAREPGVTGFFESRLSRGLFVIFLDQSCADE